MALDYKITILLIRQFRWITIFLNSKKHSAEFCKVLNLINDGTRTQISGLLFQVNGCNT
jgi:hypothetical protein